MAPEQASPQYADTMSRINQAWNGAYAKQNAVRNTAIDQRGMSQANYYNPDGSRSFDTGGYKVTTTPPVAPQMYAGGSATFDERTGTYNPAADQYQAQQEAAKRAALAAAMGQQQAAAQQAAGGGDGGAAQRAALARMLEQRDAAAQQNFQQPTPAQTPIAAMLAANAASNALIPGTPEYLARWRAQNGY
jgi:hypothetical protein